MKERGAMLVDVIIAIAIIIGLAWLLFRSAPFVKSVSRVELNQVAESVLALRQAAYTWKDSRGFPDFSGVSLSVLQNEGFVGTSMPPSINFTVAPDPAHPWYVRIMVAPKKATDLFEYSEDLEKRLRGVYQEYGVEVEENFVWFSF